MANHIYERDKQYRGDYLLLPIKWEVEAVTRNYSFKKVLLKLSLNSQENTCAAAFFLIKLQPDASNLIKKETLTQVFSFEFYKIFKKTFFIEHLQWLLLENDIHDKMQ